MRISDWSSDVCSSDLLECFSLVGSQRIRGGELTRRRPIKQQRRALSFHIAEIGAVLRIADQRGEFRIEVPRHFGRIDEILVFAASEPAEAIADDEAAPHRLRPVLRSDVHTSKLPSLMRTSDAVF